MSKKDIIIVLFLNIIWGTSFAFAGYAMAFYTPIFLYALRFFSTGVLTIPFNKFPKTYFKKILILSLFQTLTFWGVALGVKYLDSSTTAILTRLDIIFTIILGAIFFKEKITIKISFGIFICFFAVYIISGGIQFHNLKYIFLMLIASLASGCANIIVKTIKNANNMQIVSWTSFFMGIELFIISFLLENKFIIQTLNLKAIITIVYLGLISGYLAYIVLYYLLRKYKTSQIMPYNFLRPIISIIFGFILLGEPITSRKIIGIIMILCGVFISQYNYDDNDHFIKIYKKIKNALKKQNE